MIFSLLLLSNAINHHIVPMVNEMVFFVSIVRTSINHNHLDVASAGLVVPGGTLLDLLV